MAIGDVHTQLEVGAGSFTFTPAGTNVFLITSIFQGQRIRLNVDDGTNQVQIVHSVIKVNKGDSDENTINIQKIFVTNSQFFEFDSLGAGETSVIGAIQTA